MWKCTPSVINDGSGVRISLHNEAADVGKVAHELSADYVDDGEYSIGKRSNDAGLDNCHRDDLIDLMSYVVRAWDELEKYFPMPKTECVVESDVFEVDGKKYQIKGTSDVLSAIGTNNGIFADWKSGYVDSGYHQQIAGYAYTLWCVLGRPADCTITGIVVFLRHRYYRVVKFDATKLSQWEYDLTHNIIPRRNVYSPDKQCLHCDRYVSCEARKSMVEATIDTMLLRNRSGDSSDYVTFLDDAKDLISGLTEENKNDPKVAQAIRMLSHRVAMINQVSKNAKDLIREAVSRVGDIPIDENTALTMRQLKIKKVDPVRGIKVLRRHLSDSELCESMSLSLPKLTTCYASHAKRGNKFAAKEQLTRELERASAITISTQDRLEEIDISKPQEQSNAKASSEHTHSVARGDEPGGTA